VIIARFDIAKSDVTCWSIWSLSNYQYNLSQLIDYLSVTGWIKDGQTTWCWQTTNHSDSSGNTALLTVCYKTILTTTSKALTQYQALFFDQSLSLYSSSWKTWKALVLNSFCWGQGHHFESCRLENLETQQIYPVIVGTDVSGEPNIMIRLGHN